jgi:hypothetical protein
MQKVPLQGRESRGRGNLMVQAGVKKKGNVHVMQNVLQSSPESSTCLLRSCLGSFMPRIKGKRQLFCSPTCRVAFFWEARVIGAALLKRSLVDPGAENYVKDLLEVVNRDGRNR